MKDGRTLTNKQRFYAILAELMKPDDFKSLVKEIGALIDARAKTTETVIKAHVSEEIKSTEERINAEILAARAEAKADHLQLAGKVDRITKRHERRLEALEDKTGIQDPNKN